MSEKAPASEAPNPQQQSQASPAETGETVEVYIDAVPNVVEETVRGKKVVMDKGGWRIGVAIKDCPQEVGVAYNTHIEQDTRQGRNVAFAFASLKAVEFVTDKRPGVRRIIVRTPYPEAINLRGDNRILRYAYVMRTNYLLPKNIQCDFVQIKVGEKNQAKPVAATVDATPFVTSASRGAKASQAPGRQPSVSQAWPGAGPVQPDMLALLADLAASVRSIQTSIQSLNDLRGMVDDLQARVSALEEPARSRSRQR